MISLPWLNGNVAFTEALHAGQVLIVTTGRLKPEVPHIRLRLRQGAWTRGDAGHSRGGAACPVGAHLGGPGVSVSGSKVVCDVPSQRNNLGPDAPGATNEQVWIQFSGDCAQGTVFLLKRLLKVWLNDEVGPFVPDS